MTDVPIQSSEQLRKTLLTGKRIICDSKEGLVKLWYDRVTERYFLNKTVSWHGDTSTESFQAATLEEATALFVLLISKARYVV